MSMIKVDIDETKSLGDLVSKKNLVINDMTVDMIKGIKKANDFWGGRGAEHMLGWLNELEKENENRKRVLDNYSKLLLDEVSLGGLESEEVNKKLADAFK